MDKKDKVKVQLDREVANELLNMKHVGETYSDVIRRLIELWKKYTK